MTRRLPSLATALALLALGACSPQRPAPDAAEPAPPSELPTAGDVTLEHETWDNQNRFNVTFPAPMVPDGALDQETAASPLRLDPPAPLQTTWLSDRLASVRVTGRLAPSTRYRVDLASGLTNLAGTPVNPKGWEYTFSTPPFMVSFHGIAPYADGDNTLQTPVPLQPLMVVAFTAPVEPAELAATATFRDVFTRAHYTAEVILRPGQGTNGRPVDEAYLRPVKPLPLDGTYQLVLDGTREAISKRPLPFPAVLPVGSTGPLGVEWVLALNQPFERPRIQVKFTEKLEPDSVRLDQVNLDPPVDNVRLITDSDDLFIEGDFHAPGRYVVTLARDIQGIRGIGMEQNERWGATFAARRPTVAFPPEALLSQPASLGMNLAFIQINTGELTWRLAQLPLDQLAAVEKTLRDYRDPRLAGDRLNQLKLSGPVIDSRGLSVVAEGKVPASGNDEEVLRQLRWKPDGLAAPGLFLLEVTGQGPQGESIGNRLILSLDRYAAVRKDYLDKSLWHVINLADGTPGNGLPVTLRDSFGNKLDGGTTDAQGDLTLPRRDAPYITLGKGSAALTQTVNTRQFYVTGNPSTDATEGSATLVTAVFTDRNLYRPGDTVKFKGITRQRTGESLGLSTLKDVFWKVSHYGREIAHGSAGVTPGGGWSGEWVVPDSAELGSYDIGGAGGSASLQVEEYKQPPFSVTAEAQDSLDGTARATVASQLFHGAPNAGALVRWTATWYPETYSGGFSLGDEYSEHSPTRGFSYSALMDFPKAAIDYDAMFEARDSGVYEASGEAVLGADGTASIACPGTEAGISPANRAYVSWTFQITAPDGSNLGAADTSRVQWQPVIPGIETGGDEPGRAAFKVGGLTLPEEDAPDGGQTLNVTATLYRVDARTALETLSPRVARYRNSLLFNQVWQEALTTPNNLDIPVDRPGRYVLVVQSAAGGLPVSAEMFVAAPVEEPAAPAQYPVTSPTEFRIGTDKDTYRPGDTAKVKLQAPFSGLAWVSVETDRILDQFVVEVKNNAAAIDLPVKAAYAPNVNVCVYLFKPGDGPRLPAERLGLAQMRVEQPDKELAIQVDPVTTDVRPGDPIKGVATVRCQGKPVAGAEVTLFAVDESILEYGGWSLPGFTDLFYPMRPHRVATYQAVSALVNAIGPASLTQKGWLLGDGGGDMYAVTLRENFRALAYWSDTETSDAQGRVPFDFPAPDSLTAYRIVAVAHTKTGQFGDGSDRVRVNKPLQIEPALPRFVRVGDQVELRAIIRQDFADEAVVLVSCQGDGLITLSAKESMTVKAPRGVPTIVRFPAKVGESLPGKTPQIRFRAHAFKQNEKDAVAVNLPIKNPAILIRQAESGDLKPGSLIDIRHLTPTAWQAAEGTGDVLVSSSHWLPEMAGLPEVLDYPHGCFEQISSRVLAFTLLRDLLNDLPVSQDVMDDYERGALNGIEQYRNSQLPNGALPYWPGGKDMNTFATVQAAWSLLAAQQAGIDTAGNLLEGLLNACRSIVRKQTGFDAPPFTRAFALMVLAESGDGFPDDIDARELYLNRDKLDRAGRAMLALALNRLGILKAEQKHLLAEIGPIPNKKSFDPLTFGSPTRTEAMVALAHARIEGPSWTPKERRAELDKLSAHMVSAAELSTQENLWLLVAFQAVLRTAEPVAVGQKRVPTPPDAVSVNGVSIAWLNRPLSEWGDVFPHPFAPANAASYLLRAAYRGPVEQQPENRGIFLDRRVINLTDPARKGTAEAPLRIGDELVITYHIKSEQPQYFVALGDELPACIETKNAAIAGESATYQLPAGVDNTVWLSHAEHRDDRTFLFFDRLPAGAQTFSVLARVTAGGTFRWPASQISPMYDARFSGLTASSLIHANGQFR